MADDGMYRDMTKVARPVHGPRSIAAVVPVVTRTAFKRANAGLAQLIESWDGMVGPAIGAATTPRRLVKGTLTIGCSGPMAMELQHVATELLDRINQYLGRPVVMRLRFEQTMTTRRPSPRPGTRLGAAPDVDLGAAVDGIPDGPLRAALMSLRRAVLAEPPSRLGK